MKWVEEGKMDKWIDMERRDGDYIWTICNRQIVVTALLFLWKDQRWNVTRVFYHFMTLFPMAIFLFARATWLSETHLYWF